MTDLNDIKEPNFDIPKGYFEKMEAQVFDKINQKNKTHHRHVFVRWTATVTSIAAVMCSIFFGVKYFNASEEISVNQNVVFNNTEEVNAFFQTIQPVSTTLPIETTDTLDILTVVGVNDYPTESVSSENAVETSTNDISEQTETYIMENYNIMELATL